MKTHASNLRDGCHAWLGNRWRLVVEVWTDSNDVTTVVCSGSTFQLSAWSRVDVL